MFDLPENIDSYTQEDYHKAAEQLIKEKLKDPNYKNTVLEKIIYNQMMSDALGEISDAAYRKRLEKYNEKQKNTVECVCDKIRSLLGGN